ncbi:hypothetical protein [Leucobacter ruminantium]|uniref:Uncharacterized protein n=1 Tax=Leucobacter ruminantium TaxID=1289170 RepID=A0A939LW83_9MICO|nr:hypothetical protein [Leucobacter ruminantium]MBO1805909.1 hypothetical protein [Leucobacter ruminantium]
MSAYAAHADLCAVIHAHEDPEMLVEMHAMLGRLGEYPVSGDMIALIRHGTRADVQHRRHADVQHRRRAAAREQRATTC